jgi:thiamine kinase-like enzyme
MTLTVEEAIARVPMWEGAREVRFSPLGGGITNRNYRVDVDGKSYHLRLAGESTELLGIDREYEYHANQAAGELGIAPEVIYFIRPEGYLVCRFIDGRPIPPEEIRQPENIQRVVEAIHAIHSMPTIPGVFNVFQVVREYADVARRYNVEFPENFDWMVSQMNDAEAALKVHPLVQRPCHNDLLNANFMLTDRQLFILDWEYAGMGDIFFDLANFSAHHELSDNEIDFLLDRYFGEVRTQDQAHLNIMKIMSDIREAMWALVQIGISDLDFDYRAYANKHFDRATQNMLNPNWEGWLKDVSS